MSPNRKPVAAGARKAAGKAGRKPAGPAPDRAVLHEAALRHLSRFAATEAGLRRVLERRVERWARADAAEGGAGDAGTAMQAAREVARALVAAGMVDDAAFAAARTARLRRTGHSRRAAEAHLLAKGVDGTVADAVLAEADPAGELPAATVFARKRRIGPFRAEQGFETRQKDLAALARAGFGRDVAERVLALDPAEAEELVLAARRGA